MSTGNGGGGIGAIVGGIIGAVIGAVTSYGVNTYQGFVIGSAIGGAIGGAIDPGSLPDVVGPRLSDLKVQSANVGTPIPILFGTSRFAGNVLWSSGIVETRHEEEQGGKGGGPSQTTVTFSYSASFAVGLCEGTIKGIRRIWADANLIYDISNSGDLSAQAAAGMIDSIITVYPGDNNQNPDPTIEAYVGAGNTPAYRGMAYVVFSGLQLKDYYNRIPNLEFEVVSDGVLTIADNADLQNDVLFPWVPAAADPRRCKNDHEYNGGVGWKTSTDLALADKIAAGANPIRTAAYVGWSRDGVHLYNADTSQIPGELEVLYLHYNSGDFSGNYYPDSGADTTVCNWMFNHSPRIQPGQTFWWTGKNSGGTVLSSPGWYVLHITYALSSVDSAEGSLTTCGIYPPVWSPITKYTSYQNGFVASTPDGAAHHDFDTYRGPGYPGSTYLAVTNVTAIYYDNTLGYVVDISWHWKSPPADGSIVFTDTNTFLVDARPYYPAWGFSPDTIIQVRRKVRSPDNPCLPRCDKPYPLLPENNAYCLISSQLIANTGYGQDFNSYKALTNYGVIGSPSTVNEYPLGPVILAGSANDTQAFWTAAYNAAVVGGQIIPSGEVYPTDYPETKTYAWKRIRPTKQLDPNQELLSAIVSRICVRCGLSTSQINVSTLLDLVHGYVIAQPMTGRAAIQGLTAAYFFDAVESDALLKFNKRGGAPLLTIPENLLDARPDSQKEGPLINITRAQQLDLPTRVRVQFLDFVNNYQVGQQYAERTGTGVENVMDVQLAIVLTPTQAIQIADRVLYDIWQSRVSYSISVPRDYTLLDPTDVITVQANGNNYPIRITDIENAAGIIKIAGVSNQPALFNSYVSAIANGGRDGALGPLSPTILNLYNFPALHDEEDGPGFYVSAFAPLTNWHGAAVQRSIDGDVTWGTLYNTTSNAITGVCTTTLGAGPQSLYDRVNTVTVKLDRGTLSSAAGELALLNGANACAIGLPGTSFDTWEILQFKNAMLNMDGTYTLSTLIRGRKGSEWAIGLHVANEQFILLTSANLSWYPGSTARLNIKDDFRAVTLGGPVTGNVVPFTARGVALECYAPTHIKGSRSGGGDLTITWMRRNRLDGEWRDKVDVPMSEATEKYQVNVMNGSAVISIITVTSATATYTVAQQIADFGSAQLSITVGIFQINATINGGTIATATL